MGITVNYAKLTANLNWDQVSTIAGFQSSDQKGPFALSISPPVSATDVNVIYPTQGTLGVGASVTINLNSITDSAFGKALTPVRAYSFVIQGSGATWSYGPASVTPLNWFLSASATISGAAGEWFVFGGKTATAITNGAKQVTITNTDAVNTLTYSIGVVLGT